MGLDEKACDKLARVTDARVKDVFGFLTEDF
jgi:hypothetical protein